MNVLYLYINLRLDLNSICVYEWIICVSGYEIWFIVFVIDNMWYDYCECDDYENVILCDFVVLKSVYILKSGVILNTGKILFSVARKSLKK
jgi:hypothetical protein